METSSQSHSENRDYSTISPSARSLLLLKGHTNIPFARKAAELMQSPEKYDPDPERMELSLLLRLVHFESRYWSIDQLLAGLPVRNILELSSGFSFRGLETTTRNGYYYIDTDLPEVIVMKKRYVTALQPTDPGPDSKLEILPLNALDENEFTRTVEHFPTGEIAIVNEGLLMYLSIEEKKKLCGIVHKLLSERGGYWITADIYINRPFDDPAFKRNDKLTQFFEQHRVQENMFDSFESAELFFSNQGFVLDKEAEFDPSKLSSLPYLMKIATPEQLQKMQKAGKIHATWRLRAVPRSG